MSDRGEHYADLHITIERHFKDIKRKAEELELWAVHSGYTRQECREMKATYIKNHGGSYE